MKNSDDNMDSYSFYTDDAKKYGAEEAIFLYNIRFWITHNVANKRHYHDGKYWTYNSQEAFTKLFPFWSRRQIQRIIKNLKEKGAIVEGNFNKKQYDQTKWYALSNDQTVQSNEPNGAMERTKSCDGTNESVQPIPDINTDLSTNINKDIKQEKEKIESEEDVKAFVDFALQNNLLPDQVSRKIAINYFNCIRLTRSSCKISENVLSNLVERMKKYTADQLNYAMWMHTDKHDDKKEQYTLGILRNTDVAEARRGLMKMKNITPKRKGVHYDAGAEQRIKEYSQYNVPF